MKLIRATRHRLRFSLAPQEKQVLCDVLHLYPRVPATHHRVTRGAPSEAAKESQHLLDDALAEQRREHKKQIGQLLHHPERFETNVKGEVKLSLLRTEAEWLLQILNDIRVGSWLNLGSPEDIHHLADETSGADFWAMEIAGFFQSELLEALNPET